MADFKITKIIEKKRDSKKLTDDEIKYFIDCVVKSSKPDNGLTEGSNIDRSQIGALLMAIYMKGMDKDEASTLTEAMTHSGFIFSWPEQWRHLVVDKHSTGGVGDKVSLALVPALAAVGLKVPMISGRSLSHTGGTLDKLESIPGFRVCLTKEELFQAVESVGGCIAGQTEDCVPADKILYQCREITGTVSSPPLIVASIVSKKLSEGLNALVYDVKFGKGSVFRCKSEAEETAKSLVQSSRGVKTTALLTSMENPLGKAIGNSLEVIEVIDCLKGKGPPDVMELTCALGAELLLLVQGTARADGKSAIREVLENGSALQKFHNMIMCQGVAKPEANELCYGNAESVLPKAQRQTEIFYDGSPGYIQEIDPLVLATIAKEEFEHSNKHLGVGLVLLKVVGDSIIKGEAWIRVYHQKDQLTDRVLAQLKNAISVDCSKKARFLIDKRIYLDDDPTSRVLIEEYS